LNGIQWELKGHWVGDYHRSATVADRRRPKATSFKWRSRALRRRLASLMRRYTTTREISGDFDAMDVVPPIRPFTWSCDILPPAALRL